MELLSTQEHKPREPQLTRDDWIIVALQTLMRDGVEAVQVARLARDLNVTRGSFYWHFKSRRELLHAMLQEWRVRNTGIMLSVLKDAQTLEDGILELFSVWVDHSKFDSMLDQAVRDWARRDDEIKELITAEDDDRVSAIAKFFRRNGYEKTEAFIRARVIYFTQLSYYALGVAEPAETRMSYLSAYFESFTGRQLDAAVAKAYRTRFTVKGRKT